MNELIEPYVKNPDLLILPTVLIFLTAFFSHWFAQKRKIDELLFNARREVYQTFISELGSSFSNAPAEITELLLFVKEVREKGASKASPGLYEWKNKKTKHEHLIKIAHLFSNCRLVAGQSLEKKLRHYYGIISKEAVADSRDNSKERYWLGYEIEVLMRYDLRVIGIIELLLWRTWLVYERLRSYLNCAEI